MKKGEIKCLFFRNVVLVGRISPFVKAYCPEHTDILCLVLSLCFKCVIVYQKYFQKKFENVKKKKLSRIFFFK